MSEQHLPTPGPTCDVCTVPIEQVVKHCDRDRPVCEMSDAERRALTAVNGKEGGIDGSEEAYTTAQGLTVRMATEHLIVDEYDCYHVRLTFTPPTGYRAERGRHHELWFCRKVPATKKLRCRLCAKVELGGRCNHAFAGGGLTRLIDPPCPHFETREK